MAYAGNATAFLGPGGKLPGDKILNSNLRALTVLLV
jgi:hypothetical protein